MKNAFDFKTLAEFLEYFKDEETCREHFTAIRFRNGEYCPHCGHKEIYKFSGGKRYRCAKCKQDFTIKTGTVFGESKLPIRKWFIAIYLLTSCKKGISSVELASKVGVTQKTGWFMDHRLREAMKQNGGQLFGAIEADESYIGGLEKNKHAKKKLHLGATGGKTCVFGMVKRDGDAKATVLPAVTGLELHKAINASVAPSSVIYTDNFVGYSGLDRNYTHAKVNHRAGEYVRFDAHTNTIESFWALFKRKYHGVHHWMSPKHMQRYVDEAVFRFNHRDNPIQRIFTNTIERIAESSKLSYKTLIQKAA